MSDLIATITEDINASTITSSLTTLVPFIVTFVPVVVGIIFLGWLIYQCLPGRPPRKGGF